MAEPSASSDLGFPVNSFIERDELLLDGGCFDKPAIERVVKNWFIGTPAVWITVFVFLNVECFVLFFEFNSDPNIRSSEIGCIAKIIRQILLLDKLPSIIGNFLNEAALTVDNRHVFSVFVFHQHGRNIVLAANTEIVCSESRRRVYNARSVFCADEIAGNDAEGLFNKLSRGNIGHQLVIPKVEQFLSFVFGSNFPGYSLVTCLVSLKIAIFCFSLEKATYQIPGQNDADRLVCICVECFYFYV